jgi:hypothetical protein
LFDALQPGLSLGYPKALCPFPLCIPFPHSEPERSIHDPWAFPARQFSKNKLNSCVLSITDSIESKVAHKGTNQMHANGISPTTAAAMDCNARRGYS